MFRKKKKEAAPIVQVKKANAIIFSSYLALGVYFINKQFAFFKIPEQISKFDNWISLVAGFFLLLGAMHYYKAKK